LYKFLATLVDFVLPSTKKSNILSPAAVSGVVEFGFPPQAMRFFPQFRVSLDAYPKTYGLNIHFVTNASGQGVQNKARALLSGFQIPFIRS